MKVTTAIARQLQLLDVGDADALVTRLTDLGTSLSAAVPSCISVSVSMSVVGSALPVTLGMCSEVVGPVLASLAVSRSVSEPGDIVLFQASEAGAFLLLADDLRALLDPTLLVRIDEHLDLEVDPTARGLARSLEDLSAVNRAVGVLIERGLLPADAHAELSRRAQQDDKDIAGAARALLESIQLPATTVDPDTNS